jgi:hypothetical protein
MSMSALERRIQQLEDLYHSSPWEESPEVREERRADFLEMYERAREKAEREEAEGKPQRRIALENLLESISRRRRA